MTTSQHTATVGFIGLGDQGARHARAIATGLQKHTGGLKTPKERQKTVPQGAATSVLLAASPLLDKVGGRYFEDCNEAPVVTRRTADYSGVAWYAVDRANAEWLWDTALNLLPA